MTGFLDMKSMDAALDHAAAEVSDEKTVFESDPEDAQSDIAESSSVLNASFTVNQNPGIWRQKWSIWSYICPFTSVKLKYWRKFTQRGIWNFWNICIIWSSVCPIASVKLKNWRRFARLCTFVHLRKRSWKID